MKENISYETMIISNAKVDRKKRYKQILEVLSKNKEMTAKEIAVEMYNKNYIPTTERNFTAPRLTELVENNTVEVSGKKRCSYTGKMVSTYKLKEA